MWCFVLVLLVEIPFNIFFKVGILRARELREAVKNVISDKKVICDDLAQN